MEEKEIEKKYELKKAFRWTLSVDGIDSDLICRTSRPRFIKQNNGNWEICDICFVMYDSVDPSGSKQVIEIIKTNKKRKASIRLLSENGDVLEKWEMIVDLYEVDFGNLYELEDVSITIKVKMRVHDASLVL